MTWSMLSGRERPIGLDLNGARTMVVQGSRRAAVRRPTPRADPDAAEWIRLAGVLERRGFRGRGVSLAVPGPALIVETLELPPPESGAPLDDLARMELATMHGLAPDGLTAAAIPLPRGRDGAASRSLAVGCRMADLQPLLEGAQGAGLRVDHVTAGGLAVAARIAEPGGDAAGAGTAGATATDRLLVIAGWRWTEVLVLRDGRLASMRVLPDSNLAAIETGLERMGADPDEREALLRPAGSGVSGDPANAADPDMERARDELLATYAGRLATEVRRSLAYVEQEYGAAATAELQLVGEGAACPGLEASAAAAVQLPRSPASAGAAAAEEPARSLAGDARAATAAGPSRRAAA